MSLAALLVFAAVAARAQVVDFDAALKPAAPTVDVPDAPRPKKDGAGKIEKRIFKATWWGYHAAWGADFATTGAVLARGGYETDHLYTQFGNKNMGGVMGSAAAVHAAASAGSWELQKAAEKSHGIKKALLETAAIGINGYGIAVHTGGALHNERVLSRWNSR